MTDDLSASRDRMKQLKEAVDAVDDFISKNCQNADEPLQVALEGITKMSSRIRRAVSGEMWTEVKEDRQLTAVRRLVESVGGELLEVDTENSGSAIAILNTIDKVIRPIMPSKKQFLPTRKGHDLYLWHVPGDYDDSDWRVIYTLPIPEEEFEELVSEKYADLENEVAVAEVMLS
jgi:hypothetical protein